MRATGLAAGRLATVLTMLELKAMVRDMGGGNWIAGKLFRQTRRPVMTAPGGRVG